MFTLYSATCQTRGEEMEHTLIGRSYIISLVWLEGEGVGGSEGTRILREEIVQVILKVEALGLVHDTLGTGHDRLT